MKFDIYTKLYTKFYLIYKISELQNESFENSKTCLKH